MPAMCLHAASPRPRGKARVDTWLTVAIEIIGREEELAELRRFLDPVDRVPAAFLIEGEPGIGKTVLWLAGLELARERDVRVLTAIPATAETRLSFAALADLLGPVLPEVLTSLPPPQRRALEVALLLDDAEGSPPDQRAVAFAFLRAIQALARGGPVVVAVDDIQWLDGPSAFMVEFALAPSARRASGLSPHAENRRRAGATRSRAGSPRECAPAADAWTAQPRRSAARPERPTRPGVLAPEPASPPSSSRTETRSTRSSLRGLSSAGRSGSRPASPCRPRSGRSSKNGWPSSRRRPGLRCWRPPR